MMTMSHAACCAPCHFAWEEEHVLPYLPLEHQEWILREHAFMREYRRSNGDWPRAYIVLHAETEDPIFKRYLPPAMFQRMEHEHKLLGRKAQIGLSLDD